MSVALPGMSHSDLSEKIKVFRINYANYKEKIAKFPKVRIHASKVEAWKWCQDHCGNNWIWSSPTQTDYCDIYFIHEGDAIMFKLAFATT